MRAACFMLRDPKRRKDFHAFRRISCIPQSFSAVHCLMHGIAASKLSTVFRFRVDYVRCQAVAAFALARLSFRRARRFRVAVRQKVLSARLAAPAGEFSNGERLLFHVPQYITSSACKPESARRPASASFHKRSIFEQGERTDTPQTPSPQLERGRIRFDRPAPSIDIRYPPLPRRRATRRRISCAERIAAAVHAVGYMIHPTLSRRVSAS